MIQAARSPAYRPVALVLPGYRRKDRKRAGVAGDFTSRRVLARLPSDTREAPTDRTNERLSFKSPGRFTCRRLTFTVKSWPRLGYTICLNDISGIYGFACTRTCLPLRCSCFATVRDESATNTRVFHRESSAHPTRPTLSCNSNTLRFNQTFVFAVDTFENNVAGSRTFFKF